VTKLVGGCNPKDILQKINFFMLFDYFNMLILKIIFLKIKKYFNLFLNKKYFKK